MIEPTNVSATDRRCAPSAPVLAAGHVFRWLPTGASAIDAMLRLIEQARHRVSFEFYICKPGAVADRFRVALVDASRRGVLVQVLLDAFGSTGVAGGYWRELENSGGHLRWFNPVRLLRLSFRNHRKLLVVDNGTAIVGGINLADEYDGDGIAQGWRDMALELRGPVVRIPAQADHRFRLNPITDSGASRSPVPVEPDHRFRWQADHFSAPLRNRPGRSA